MVFSNGGDDAYAQMVEVEPGIWAIPGVVFHYLRANQRYFERTGKRFRSTEGFRPRGNPGDFDGRPSTQWYYWERKIAQPWQPSGAYPGGSIHGWGRAFDIDLGQPGLEYSVMRECLEAEGFFFDIIDEDWHCNYYATDMWFAYSLAGLTGTPLKSAEQIEEEELMTAQESILAAIAEAKHAAEVSRPLKLIAVTTSAMNGWIWVDQEGDWVPCPSGAYANLVAAWGWSQPSPIRLVTDQAEFDYMTRQLLDPLNQDAKAGQVDSLLSKVAAVKQLSEARVTELLATPTPNLTKE